MHKNEPFAQIQVDFRFAIKELTHPKVPDTLERNNTTYHFQVEVSNTNTKFIIGKYLKGSKAENAIDRCNEIAFELLTVLNQFIVQIRTFYHDQNDFYLLSPTTIQNLNFQLLVDNKLTFEQAVSLKNQMPPSLVKFYEIINDNPYEDWWDVIGEEDQATYITLIMDAWYLYTESKFNEAIISCCTAIESYIFPILSDYFKNLTLSKSDKIAKEIVLDISMPARIELLFGTVENEFLGHMTNLLKHIKQLFTTRNSIIHRGGTGTANEAWNGLENTSKLFLASFIKIDDLKD